MNKQASDDRKRRISATIAFFSEAIRFIVLPLLVLYIILSNFPLLAPDMMMRRMAGVLIIFGGLIALFSSMEAYFPLGTKLKMIFGILSIATLCAWFWFLFTGESITMPYGPVTITIDIVGLVFVIMIAIGLKALVPVARFMMIKEDRKKKRAAVAAASAPIQQIPVQSSKYSQARGSSDELEPPPPEDFTISCPVCKAEISPKDDVCPRCGTWIRHKI